MNKNLLIITALIITILLTVGTIGLLVKTIVFSAICFIVATYLMLSLSNDSFNIRTILKNLF
jgi:hypothetical protein